MERNLSWSCQFFKKKKNVVQHEWYKKNKNPSNDQHNRRIMSVPSFRHRWDRIGKNSFLSTSRRVQFYQTKSIVERFSIVQFDGFEISSRFLSDTMRKRLRVLNWNTMNQRKAVDNLINTVKRNIKCLHKALFGWYFSFRSTLAHSLPFGRKKQLKRSEYIPNIAYMYKKNIEYLFLISWFALFFSYLFRSHCGEFRYIFSINFSFGIARLIGNCCN